jgi:hypothetical protein
MSFCRLSFCQFFLLVNVILQCHFSHDRSAECRGAKITSATLEVAFLFLFLSPPKEPKVGKVAFTAVTFEQKFWRHLFH